MMELLLSSLVDRGCWISDDRVNASITTNGIGEIGYHGRQPVSRNSRIFASENGCIKCFYGGTLSELKEIPIDLVEWTSAVLQIENPESIPTVRVRAEGRTIHVQFTSRITHSQVVAVKFDLASCVREVQGERSWSEPSFHERYVSLVFRDRITLPDWMKKQGPYSGDFMIPEPWRQILFTRHLRSGTATFDDLRDEYQDAFISIYDTKTTVMLGGSQFNVNDEKELLTFHATLEAGCDVEFTVRFIERECVQAIHTTTVKASNHSPHLTIPGYPAVESFFQSVPSIVNSAVIRDLGMPRASAGAYYWIWAWDSIVTALTALRWGNAQLGYDVARFINAHRDDGGRIPMRWTRDLQPLDTPPRGGLEALNALLVDELRIQCGFDYIPVYPHFVRHFTEIESMTDEYGRFANGGFYPDLPGRFHREKESSIAMEVGLHYVFCRILSELAREIGDEYIRDKALFASKRIKRYFLENFWCPDGFLCDSIHMRTNEKVESHPLFSLMFLLYPEAIDLLDDRVPDVAQFIENHHLTAYGIRTVPSWDINSRSETVSYSWYPHWDIYAIKLLRKEKRPDAIMHWLGCVENVLSHLGYCPEFLTLNDFNPAEIRSWKRHGAASNLNCVTGWFHALIEGLTGVEFHPRGLTITPCKLPLGDLELDGIYHLQTMWRVTVIDGNSDHCTLFLDGERLTTLELGRSCFDGNSHHLTIRYGS